MSSQFIEELLGYPELFVSLVEVIDNRLHVYGSSCLERGISVDLSQGETVVGYRERVIYELPILNYAVVLHLRVRKYKTSVGSYYWESLSFARSHSHYTKRYEEHLYAQCKGSDISRVADLSGIGVDTLQGIFHYYAKKNSTV
jgi:Helix-turn-helix domain of transposase family ISL3